MMVAASKYGENKDVFIKGVEWAFAKIAHEINYTTINRYNFNILHLYDFMDKTLGKKG